MHAESSEGLEAPLVLQSTTYYPSGMQVGHFSNGISVAGTGGETVSSDSQPLGEEGSPPAGIEGVNVEAGSDERTGADYTEYDALQALGVSDADLADFGLTPACPSVDTSLCGSVAEQNLHAATHPQSNRSALDSSVLISHTRTSRALEPVCVRLDHSKVYAYGCARRKWLDDPGTHQRFSTTSKVSGEPKGIYWLVRLRTRHNYHNDVAIFDWKPTQDLSASSCTDRTLSLSYNGVGASASATHCPEKWDMSPPNEIGSDTTSGTFTNSWYKFRGVRSTRGVAAVNATRRYTSNSGFAFRVEYTWCYC